MPRRLVSFYMHVALGVTIAPVGPGGPGGVNRIFSGLRGLEGCIIRSSFFR